MKRSGLWSEAVFLLAVFLLYLGTLAPFLFWRDAPEFVDAVTILGVAHPAGFPTYSLMARWAYLLPLGNIPFRINLFSMLCAVGALGVFLRTSRRLLEAEGAGETEARLLSLGAAGILAVGYPFWNSALSAEVYTLHLLFVALVLHLAVRWYCSGDDRFIYLCALVYGIGAGNHATMALLLPGLLIFFCAKNREDTFRKLLLLGTFFLIGFSVYLYLPIRSSTYPNMDWGEPRTLLKMLSHMTDRKDSGAHTTFLTGGLWGWAGALRMQGEKILQTITLLGVALALPGLVWNTRRFPLVMVLMVFTFLPQGIFFIHWMWGGIHLQLFLVLGFWMAQGMRQLMEWGVSGKLRRLRPKKILLPVVAAVLILQIVLNYPRADLSGDRRVENSFRKNFKAMEPDALVIASILWFHYRTYQDVMRLREDITVIGSGDFGDPEHFMHVTPRRYPRILMPEGDYTGGDSGNRFLYEMVAMNLDKRRPVYLEVYHQLIKYFYRQVLPDRGFLFRFTHQPVKQLDSEMIYRYIMSIRDRFLEEVEIGGLMRENEVFHYYHWYLLAIVDYLIRHKDWGNVLRLLEFVEKFFGAEGLNSLWPWERLTMDSYASTVYIQTGQYDRAKRLLEDHMTRCTICYSDYRNLAWLYYREGRYKEAEYWLRKGMEEKPDSPQTLALLGDIESALGRVSEAMEAYRRALQETKDPGRKEVLDQKIRQLLQEETLK
ncbi:MAG: DUF2723 domain-containing protein [Deltaproteobacteria bacterium]|nr:DUF2723 domain-containing protein [Deltaproteobacteria bacterium]